MVSVLAITVLVALPSSAAVALPATGQPTTGAPARASAIPAPNLLPTARAQSVHPPLSIAPNPDFMAACQIGHNTVDNSPRCMDAVLQAINNARGPEGVAPMSLPPNFAQLSPVAQLLVVANLERTVRGLAPIAGVVPELNDVAGAAAAQNVDPQGVWTLSSGAQAVAWASNMAGGYPSVLAADYAWMYDDGPHGTNVDCPGPGASGCWGHRDNILASNSSPGATWVMGGALAGSTYGTTMTELFELIVGSSPPYSVSWSQVSHTATAGYWEVAADGGVFNFGTPPFFGSAGGLHLAKPVIGMAKTPDGQGYWLVALDGGIFNYGNAPFHGSMGGQPLAAPIVGITASPATGGYSEVASDGGIFAFDAPFLGSMGGHRLEQPVVGMASTPDGKGYWEVASDGGIFAFGNAQFYGSTGAQRLNAPIVGMASTRDGKGYWLVASDGGIFGFGDAPFLGSMGGTQLVAPIVGMTSSTDGHGYLLFAQDGGVFTFGDAEFDGSMGGQNLNQPIVGATTN